MVDMLIRPNSIIPKMSMDLLLLKGTKFGKYLICNNIAMITTKTLIKNIPPRHNMNYKSTNNWS